MSHIYCPNCHSKIDSDTPTNKMLCSDLYFKLKAILPSEFIEDAYCDNCFKLPDLQKYNAFNVVEKYEKFLRDKKRLLEKLDNQNSVLEKVRISEFKEKKENLVKRNAEDIVIYSNTPIEFQLLGFVESFQVVNSGMWSTASDNFNPLISMIHDQIASAGNNSDELLSQGFAKAKKYIKYDACLKGGNVIVDFKHTFSELAGNGKILIYSQGTAGIDKTRPVIDFNSLKHPLNSYQDIEDLLKNNKVLDLKALITSK